MDIRLERIGKSYEGRAVLTGIDLDVPSGSILVLEGENGSGKTTLVEIIAGLVTPDVGEVAIGGRAVAGVPPHERGVFYVPQSVHQFWALQEGPLSCYLPSVSVRENLEQAARRDEVKAEEFLRVFGLFPVRASDPSQLSRGQKQRLALARAFLSQQPIILLDEPLASIDPASRQDLIDTLGHLQRRYSRTLVFVTQHPDELRYLEGHRLALRDGQLGPCSGEGSLTGRILRRALPALVSALTVDAGDRLEATGVAGLKPSELLDWMASQLRARAQRALLRPSRPSRLEGVLRSLRTRFAALGASSGSAAQIATLQKELQVLRASLDELQRAPIAPPLVPQPAPQPQPAADRAPDSVPPQRLMRRRQAPWIDEPLSDKVWQPPSAGLAKVNGTGASPGDAGRAPALVALPVVAAAAPAIDSLPIAAAAKSGRRTLILRCPSLMYNYHGIPPFGLATITAELQHHGYDIRQDDLDAKSAHAELFPRHRWGKQFPAKQLMMDITRVRRHLEGQEDADVISLVERVLSLTDVSGADTVALSCIEGDDYAAVLALCLGKYLKGKLGKTVILGGEAFPHMQPIKSQVKEFYRNGCFDYYIQGYGEVALLELYRHLDAGEPTADTPGMVSVREDGTVRENRPLFTRTESVPDFSGLPMPLYYKKPDEWDEWKAEDKGVEEILVLPFKTNFCCPNKCAFCIQSGDTFTKVSSLSPEKIVEGLRTLKERYQTSYFMFADDMFNISPRWAEQVADAIIEARLDVLWSDCAFARDVTPELLQKLRRSGAIRLVWGMESGSPRLQKLVNKGLDLEEMGRILRWSHEAGIYNAIQVIAGLPTEREEDVELTVEFLRKNRAYIDQVYLNPFSLITGSLMCQQPERFGLVNVKPVSTIFQSRPDEVYSWIQRYTFDTVDHDGTPGLPWKDKVKQIEDSFRRIQETILDLDIGGHDIHTLMLRFARYGDKQHVKDFQSSRRHQGFDYFDKKGMKGHSPTGVSE